MIPSNGQPCERNNHNYWKTIQGPTGNEWVQSWLLFLFVAREGLVDPHCWKTCTKIKKKIWKYFLFNLI
ncbi:hypothetical protein XENTR_v10022336 [Xenopus tropicalis]|nr:hypothetical protein XENTR_v10022336 [Xenopus tropicalis]